MLQRWLVLVLVLLAWRTGGRIPPAMLNPLGQTEFTLPAARMRGSGTGPGVPIVLVVSDVDQWELVSMVPADIVTFTKGTLGEGGGASFRPMLTVLKPGRTVVTLRHVPTERKYPITITIPSPNGDKDTLRTRALQTGADVNEDAETEGGSAASTASASAVDALLPATLVSNSSSSGNSDSASNANSDNSDNGVGLYSDDDVDAHAYAEVDNSRSFASASSSSGSSSSSSPGLFDHIGRALRRLVGSNCVQIEYGVVSRYYTCVGCVIEQAMGCVDDLRTNKSGQSLPAPRLRLACALPVLCLCFAWL